MLMLQKLIMVVLWIACAINLVAPFAPPWHALLLVTGGFLVVAHTIECIVFKGRIDKAGGNKAAHYVQVMLFGVIHANTLPK